MCVCVFVFVCVRACVRANARAARARFCAQGAAGGGEVLGDPGDDAHRLRPVPEHTECAAGAARGADRQASADAAPLRKGNARAMNCGEELLDEQAG